MTVNKVLTDKEKFLKDYKTYSDNFQNSEKIYDAADISIKVDEQDPTTVSEISYGNKTESTSRHCVINDQYPIAGGSYEYSALKTQLDNYEAQAATFEYTKENNIVAISVFFGKILFLRYKFNSNGYLTEYGMMGELKFKTTTYIYSKEPREKTEQEKFYDVYKLASKNFQKATKEYTTSTIKCKIDGVEKEVVTVSYQTDDGVRKCVFQAKDQQMTFIIAGGDLCYFDDVTKGIKNTISYLESQLTKTATYSSNKETGECSFRVGTMSATFNKNGYITLHDTNSMNERVEYTYID